MALLIVTRFPLSHVPFFIFEKMIICFFIFLKDVSLEDGLWLKIEILIQIWCSGNS